MAIFSLIIGIAALALCFLPVIGLVISLVAVIVTVILKRQREYMPKKITMKKIGLIIAIAGFVVSVFVTGIHLTKTVITDNTNKAVIQHLDAGMESANLLQAKQHATYAWNEARMKGLKKEKMEQYIMQYLSDRGVDTSIITIEITKSGVDVKLK